MANQQPNDGELSRLERALSSLKPSGRGVDRDRLMFVAGQASVRQRSRRNPPLPWLWPALTAVSTAAALLLGVLLVSEGTRSPTESTSPIARPEWPMDTDQPEVATASDSERRSTTPWTENKGSDPVAGAGSEGPQYAATEWLRLRLRRAVLAGGVEALPASRVQVARNAPTTNTVWAESKRLRIRSSLPGNSARSGIRFSILRDLFTTGETL